MKNKKILAALLFAFLLPFSCTTMADYDFTTIDGSLYSENYSEAVSLLDENAEKIYGSKSEVLKYLDKGILLHFAGEYKESNESLSKAEELIDYYSAKSVSQAIGSAVVNDTVTDYAGEAFEDIYTNIFMCLNYIALDNDEDAMVEIRRFENKMKLLGTKYSNEIASASESLGNDFSGVTGKTSFHNSALARYLSMLLYRNDNDYDAALIDLRYLYNAFQTQGSIYDFNYPVEVKDELSDMKSARINFLAFSGRAPLKVETAIRLNLRDVYYKLALPVMTKVPDAVASVNVKAVSKSSGETYATSLSKLESIENIACDTFKNHFAAILLKTLLRSVSKAASSTAVSKAGDKADGTGSILLKLLSFTMKASTEFSERADVRTSRYFPASCYCGALELPEGEYSIQVDYCNSSGKILSSEYRTAEAKNGKLSLSESVCYL